MIILTSRTKFLISTAILFAMTSAYPAAADAAQDNAPIEEVVVTGTLIPQQPGATSVSPITSISNKDIDLSGQMNVENIVNELPQVTADNTESSNFPGTGIATLDLRGLGTNRNLILIDGRRVTPSTQDGTVDVNNIPTEMVDRVEVVTGGASSTYGSDAMSGVVNFILKRNFTGIDAKAGFGVSTYGDGVENSQSVLMGTDTDNGGNIMVDISHFQRSRILESQRSFTQNDVAALIGYSTSASGFPWQGGSPSGTPSIVNVPYNPNPKTSTQTTLSDGTNCDSVFYGPQRTFVPTATGVRGFCQVISTFGGDRYNFAPISDLVIPQTRWNVSLVGHMPVPALNGEAYIDAFYVRNETSNQRAPAPLGAYSDVTISPTSVFLNSAAQALLAARPDPTAPAYVAARLTAFGPQVYNYTANFMQLSGGLRGQIGGDWKWDLYAAYSNVDYLSVVNDIAKDRLQAEFNDCPLGSPAGCVSQSPFTAYSAAAVAWAALPNVTDRTTFERETVALNTNGTLFDLPAGPLQSAFGFEYRRDASSYTPDSQKEAYGGVGNVIGSFAALPVSGSMDVKEFFGELQVPILKDSVVHSVMMNVGGRGSDYSLVGTIWTEKAGLEIIPDTSSGLRFRGMYQVATRAPSIYELYAAPVNSRPGVQDPCDARFWDGTTATKDRCNGTTPVIGVNGTPITPVDPTSFQALSTLVNATSVGNPKLKPETAHTITLGATWKPDYVPNLYASFDFYHIKINDYISSEYGGAQGIANACYQNGDANACRVLTRDPAGNISIGSPGQNKGIQPENGASLTTAGEDIFVSYRLGLDKIAANMNGRLTASINLSHVDTWRYVALDGTVTECAGVLCSAATGFASQPKWRGVLELTYDNGPLTLQWRGRYVDEVRDSLLGGQDFLGTQIGGKIPVIGAVVYHDLNVRYAVTDTLTVNASVSNLLDTKPPVLYDAGSEDNTDIMLYNVVGRYFRVSLDVQL